MNSAQTAPVARTARVAVASSTTGSRTVLVFTYVWWVLIVMEPEWFLTGTIGGPFYRIPQLLLPGLLWVLARPPTRRAIQWPFALFMLMHVAAYFYAENRGYVLLWFKPMIYIFATCVAVAAVANTPKRILTVIKLYLLGFIWYGVQGLPSGLVPWHPLMANEDSYGPLMVIGLGLSASYAAGTQSRKWRYLSYATAALCCAGVVRSLARGAILSFVLVLGLLWLRSKNKLRALVAGAALVLATLAAITVFYPQGEFWAEMATVTEGKDAGTGQTRWIMWEMAIDIFKDHPIVGVGAGNFGVIASQVVEFDANRAEFDDPARLWGAVLHNLYLQILCEEGIVGFAIFLWMTIDFFQRLRRLRSRRSAAAWRHGGGGELSLHRLSIGLELAMIGFLASGIFYNQIYIHWYWTLVTLAFALTRVVARSRPPVVASPPPARPSHRNIARALTAS